MRKWQGYNPDMRLYADDGFGNLIPIHPVRLVSGEIVSSYSEAWRHECEARHVLSLQPLQRRRDYLYGTPNEFNRMAGGIKQRRGDVALKALEDTMLALWRKRVQDAKDHVLGRVGDTTKEGANDERIHRAA